MEQLVNEQEENLALWYNKEFDTEIYVDSEMLQNREIPVAILEESIADFVYSVVDSYCEQILESIEEQEELTVEHIYDVVKDKLIQMTETLVLPTV